MMKCGHSANAVQPNNGNKPVCVICFGNPKALEIDDNPPDLSSRMAKCDYRCGNTRPSSEFQKLAFFSHRPDREFDSYYCGCMGWD